MLVGLKVHLARYIRDLWATRQALECGAADPLSDEVENGIESLVGVGGIAGREIDRQRDCAIAPLVGGSSHASNHTAGFMEYQQWGDIEWDPQPMVGEDVIDPEKGYYVLDPEAALWGQSDAWTRAG